MNLDKSPSSYGLNHAFFKRFWHLCGREIFYVFLCNVLYKIISKVFANRLKPLLPKILQKIAQFQTISFWLIHHMRCKIKGKICKVALKVDINKAFDRVDWNYLFCLLQKMGFHETLINQIQICLQTIHYSMLINGDSLGKITPRKGIRQGDLLSPYLFILCTEGLSSMIKKIKVEGISMVSKCIEDLLSSRIFYLLMIFSLLQVR